MLLIELCVRLDGKHEGLISVVCESFSINCSCDSCVGVTCYQQPVKNRTLNFTLLFSALNGYIVSNAGAHLDCPA